YAGWEAIGPYGGFLRCLEINPLDPAVLYTACYRAPCKIFRSTDHGETWKHISTVPNYVYCIECDPVNPNIMYAGSYADIYKSTDNGFTWTIYDMPGYEINALCIRSDTTSIIYATGMKYSGGQYLMHFFRSRDAGVSWDTLRLVNYGGYAYDLAVDPQDLNTIYIGGYYYDSLAHPCIFKSTDGGNSFREQSLGLTSTCQRVQSLAVHPTNSNIVYAGTYYDGIYRSTDAGVSWHHVSGGGWFFSSMATTPAAPNIAYAASDTIIYLTTDSGDTWVRSDSGYAGSRRTHRCVRIDPAEPNLVYTTDYHGFYKSTNNGVSWCASNRCINIAQINAMTVCPSSPEIVYAYDEGYGLYRSTNCGSDWTTVSSPFACRLGDLVIHNWDPDILLALEGDG
ncbi:hypothetical protein JXB22_05720, partial [candidate division WOR-3 bacterium]|nr:hypothetical protein [candidate division WOR-3 bacterium]